MIRYVLGPGSDVVKARALGADAVLIGRSTLFGTAPTGAKGGSHLRHILKTEIECEMGLLGCRTLADITPDLLAG
ncbi:MAG: alpha-hydroxy-acid oxidizing protein [Comamonadaceae bacterium]|nr:alpha-hydroxy-acid oxidizing protein [Comamonadaceae bacterium]